MQIMVTDSWLGRTRVLRLGGWQLGAGLLALLLPVAAALYHALVLPAAGGGLASVLSVFAQPIANDEGVPGEHFARENLDAMAIRLGEMQAKLVRLEALSERVSNVAGVKQPDETRAIIKPVAATSDGRGGPYLPMAKLSQRQLDSVLTSLDERVDQHLDLLTLIESKLFEERLAHLMIPNSRPLDGPVGSGFGMRLDPFTGRRALHAGLDFPADSGTPIRAAAGGIVLAGNHHPAYGRQLEIDHGDGLVTRYAHASKMLVKAGDLVRRGQKVALVGSSGRSTGPHLHFEVLLDGVPQDPATFLAGGEAGARLAGGARQ